MVRSLVACLLGFWIAGCSETDSDVARALAAARIDTVAAIEKALAAVGDGVVTELELDLQGDLPVYAVEVAVADGVKGVRIDGTSGEVLGTRSIELDPDEAELVAELRALAPERRVGLAEAIRETGGNVVEVDLKRRGNAPVYVLDLADEGGAKREVTVEVAR